MNIFPQDFMQHFLQDFPQNFLQDFLQHFLQDFLQHFLQDFPQKFLQDFPKHFLQDFLQNFPQDFPQDLPQDFPARFFWKFFTQEFLTRFSHKIFPSWILIGWLPITQFQMLNFHQSLPFLNWLFPLLLVEQDFPIRCSHLAGKATRHQPSEATGDAHSHSSPPSLSLSGEKLKVASS